MNRMNDMDLKTRAELLPCGTCEDMFDCDDCYHRKEAKDIYQQIRAEAIDELKEKFFYEIDRNIFTDEEKFKCSRKDQEKICCLNIAWKEAKAIFEYLAEQLKEHKND